jgi:hypothetical protein
MLSLLLGSGLFILSTVATVSMGWLPPLPQGYAFGFFLFIYIGIGLGCWCEPFMQCKGLI